MHIAFSLVHNATLHQFIDITFTIYGTASYTLLTFTLHKRPRLALNYSPSRSVTYSWGDFLATLFLHLSSYHHQFHVRVSEFRKFFTWLLYCSLFSLLLTIFFTIMPNPHS
ncbi:hypothetical protein K503DRAFT_327642 [Rhizopogon vinicolor AM-OR11-026]|uniref:Uncharacterized protein n=1 Tax=Rhizopogon vinicolor AM-OR11-026 TaxID=1314800 RepID=A0A1B7NCV3_9AGAM|nr:hypothetical protein K503DRAFT_327642 [Rhizopogon vinicolor AM-OR11-026]